MKMLALEFSSPHRSVAVSDGAARRGAAADFGTREMKPFALLDAALREAGMSREEIECVVVGLGPGSYAGTRQAIAIAQGWQLARGVKLLGVSSAEAVALELLRAGSVGAVTVGLEVQRGELFVAEFSAHADGVLMTKPFQPHVAGEITAAPVHRLDWASPETPPAGMVSQPPTAEGLLALARTRMNFVSGENLEPVYLHTVEFVKAPAPKFRAD